MLVYIIPVGGGNNVFKLLHSYSYDGNLISEGIAFLINAVLLLFASLKLAKNEKGEQLSAPAVLVTSVLAFSLFLYQACLSARLLYACLLYSELTKNCVQIFYKFKRTCSSRTRYYRNCCLCYLH